MTYHQPSMRCAAVPAWPREARGGAAPWPYETYITGYSRFGIETVWLTYPLAGILAGFAVLVARHPFSRCWCKPWRHTPAGAMLAVGRHATSAELARFPPVLSA